MRASTFAVTILALMALFFEPAGLPAQSRQEISLAAGGGGFLSEENDHASPVFSFAYRLHATDHLAAEGALDFFTYTFPVGPPDQPSEYADGYSGAEIAVLYHFRNGRQARRWIPFAAIGVGRTTTDFTEIRGITYYRLGGGVSYNFSDRFGFRLEVRDEAIRDLPGSPRATANLPSIRCGLAFRF